MIQSFLHTMLKKITTCCWGGYYRHKFIQNSTQATDGVPDGARGLPASSCCCAHLQCCLLSHVIAVSRSVGRHYGEHGTLCQRGKCKLSTEMWKLIYGLYFRDCGTVRYMSPCHFFFRCSAVSYTFYLFMV